MSRTVVSHVQTDIGRKRDHNEDSFVWLQNLWGKPSITLIGAIDGVGGYAGGKEAADIAKTTIENYLQHFSFGSPLQLIKEAIITANNNINEKREELDLPRMSCVITIAVLDAEKEMMYLGHVGDSRGYLLRKGELIKLTKDHSVVGFKEDNGFLTEEEAMHHPLRNEISKMLGEQILDSNDEDSYIDLLEHSFLPEDVILLCSDGLTDLVNRQGIIEILSQEIGLPEKAQQLINKANDLGGKDNITVSLATYHTQSPRAKRAYKNTIEVPIEDDVTTTSTADKKVITKKKEWWWLLPVVFLAGFLANWIGTKNIILHEKENRDTVYIKDTLPVMDSLFNQDTLIQATDTIYRDSTRNQNTTGY